MSTIVTRAGKGSPLTNTECDSNLTNLNTDKVEKSGDTLTGDLAFGDNVKAKFGASDDLQIYHDSNNSIVRDAGTGNLELRGTNFRLGSSTGSVQFIETSSSGLWTALKYNSNVKLITSNSGIDVTGVLTTDGIATSGDVSFGDNVKAKFGAGNDLLIYHDPENGSYVSDQGVGSLNLLGSAYVRIKDSTDSTLAAEFAPSSSQTFYYNGSAKLATTSSGVDITGTVVADGLTVSANTATFSAGTSGDMELVIEADTDNNDEGDSPSLVFKQDGGNTIGRIGLVGNNNDVFTGSIANSLYIGNDELARIQLYTDLKERLRINTDGDISFYEDTGTTAKLTWDASDESLNFADNAVAKFGDSGDLRIYHTGTNSYIQDAGTGNLYVKANVFRIYNTAEDEIIANFVQNNAVTLYYDGSSKLATTSTGIDVTGTVTADSLTVEGTSTQIDLVETDVTDNNTRLRQTVGDFFIQTISDDKSTIVSRLNLDHATGDISFYDDAGTSQDFYWDASTSRLGLGTTSPDDALQVVGGNIIIGEPDENVNRTLTIHGSNTSNKTATLSLQDYIFRIDGGNPNQALELGNSSGSVYASQTYTINSNYNPSFFKWVVDSTEIMRATEDGRLGIGTTSPSAELDVNGNVLQVTGTDLSWTGVNAETLGGMNVQYSARVSAGQGPSLAFINDAGLYSTRYPFTSSVIKSEKANSYNNERNSNLVFYNHTGGAGGTGSLQEAMRITSDGRLGIGTTSVNNANKLHARIASASLPSTSNQSVGLFENSSNAWVTIGAGNTSYAGILFADSGDSDVGQVRYYHNDNSLQFLTNASEAARITSFGNLLVGKTAEDSTVQGCEARVSGQLFATSDGAQSIFLNRKTSDGTIAEFRKDGTTVGSIGTTSDDLSIHSTTANHAGLRFGNGYVASVNNSGTIVDNTFDLGLSSFRWNDAYVTNGVTQSSDENEKQQIASLSDAEITAATAISKLFKTFKWNDSVEEKGDNARTHTGVIAQQVEQAMTDAGLDASDYAFFISTTWWETQTDVEAVAEEVDEEGNVTTEAKEAYTRKDTYDTVDEAPEGATERNRKGIRYPQLLSFVSAATEQRLTSIESRLDALETNYQTF